MMVLIPVQMTKLFLFSILAACSLSGQTAKVIQLSPEDAAQAKALHDEQTSLTQRQKDFDNKIEGIYTEVPIPTSGKAGQSCVYYDASGYNYYGICGVSTKKNGWNYGFEYSDDFKFIVPKPAPSSTSTSTSTSGYLVYNYGWNNCGTVFAH